MNRIITRLRSGIHVLFTDIHWFNQWIFFVYMICAFCIYDVCKLKLKLKKLQTSVDMSVRICRDNSNALRCSFHPLLCKYALNKPLLRAQGFNFSCFLQYVHILILETHQGENFDTIRMKQHSDNLKLGRKGEGW